MQIGTDQTRRAAYGACCLDRCRTLLTHCHSEHALQIAFSVRVAKEIECSDIDSSKIVAIFARTIRFRNQNHRKFHFFAPDVAHQLPISSILKPESAKAGNDSLSRQRALCRLYAFRPDCVESKCRTQLLHVV